MRRSLLPALLGLVLIGCYSPSRVTPCEVTCTDEIGCPDGLTCEEGRCASEPGECALPVTWTAVAAGFAHTCAIDAAGGLWCWGDGDYGQVGDPSLARSARPRRVDQVGPALAIAAGGYHTCVILGEAAGDEQGSLYCVGGNGQGQLGSAGSSRTAELTQVGEAGDWRAIECGSVFTCGLHATGVIECFGANGSGQLGQGTTIAPTTPTVEVPGAWTSIALGLNQACALDGEGALSCWGHNVDGSLGLGDTAAASSPRPVQGAHRFAQAAIGNRHTCAIDVDGALWCWGTNESGELGLGSAGAVVPEPTRVGDALYASVSAGTDFTCAIDLDGGLACWGDSTFGQLASAEVLPVASPTAIGTGGYEVVATGSAHACAIDRDGVLACWGSTTDGQVGDGQISTILVPTALPGTGWVEVVAGDDFTCARKDDGSVYCFGDNDHGQLGVDADAQVMTTPSALGATFDAIGAGSDHACGRDPSTTPPTIRCWGSNEFGQVGNGGADVDDARAPVAVVGMPESTSVAVRVGGDGACALLTGPDQTYCWGRNDHGQLGTGSIDARVAAPTSAAAFDAIAAGATLADLALGDDHACALTAGGELHCVGRDNRGQRGGDTPSEVATNPVDTGAEVLTWTSLAARALFTCAVESSGALYCWGDDTNGQTGNGAAAGTAVPHAVNGPSTGWSGVSAGRFHACGVAAGQLECWGANGSGQLGDRTQVGHSAPDGAILSTPATSVAAGASHTCAIVEGILWCWGRGNRGQLGLGVSAQFAPTRVDEPD